MNPQDEVIRLHECLLVVQAQQKDVSAFSELVAMYERRLLYYLHRIVGESQAALDLLQDVWLTVYQRLSGLHSPETFRVWLYRIAHDRAVTIVRRQRREHDVLVQLAEEQEETWDEPCIYEAAELVHWALGQLSVPHREVLTLRFLEDLSVEQIAVVIGSPLATARSRLFHAKRAMRALIEEFKHA
jgi:RNA polymerase sigma-70 factor (ECF subfamily)